MQHPIFCHICILLCAFSPPFFKKTGKAYSLNYIYIIIYPSAKIKQIPPEKAPKAKLAPQDRFLRCEWRMVYKTALVGRNSVTTGCRSTAPQLGQKRAVFATTVSHTGQ